MSQLLHDGAGQRLGIGQITEDSEVALAALNADGLGERKDELREVSHASGESELVVLREHRPEFVQQSAVSPRQDMQDEKASVAVEHPAEVTTR